VGPVMLTIDVLRAVAPFTPPNVLEQRLPALQRTVDLAGATTPERAAALLAQFGYESGFFKAMVEKGNAASFARYEQGYLAQVLGNLQPGDGARYCGRGFTMLTGKANYVAAGAALGLDLVGSPDLAADPDVAAQVAAWYWLSRGLNALADAENFEAITRKINGGLTGQAGRIGAYNRARGALGLPKWAGAPRAG